VTARPIRWEPTLILKSIGCGRTVLLRTTTGGSFTVRPVITMTRVRSVTTICPPVAPRIKSVRSIITTPQTFGPMAPGETRRGGTSIVILVRITTPGK
jgi:hypothetical protein